MYSLEADTGAECWSLPLLTPYSRVHPTFGTDGNLYFGGPGWFVAVDHITKIPAWLFTTPTTNNLTGVIGADGTVYLGSDGGSFYAIWSSSLGGFGQSPWPAAGQNVRHNGLAPTRPKILNQPGSQVVALGGPATLTAIVVGRPPLTLQLMFNGQPMATATNIGLILTYNFSDRLGLSLNLPIIYNSFEHTDLIYFPPGPIPFGTSKLVTEKGQEWGPGDLALIGRWTAFQKSTMRWGLNVNLLGGIKLPTGDSSRLDDEPRPPKCAGLSYRRGVKLALLTTAVRIAACFYIGR